MRARTASSNAAASALLVAAISVAATGCSVLCEAVSVPGVCAERTRPNVGGPISRNHEAPEPVYGAPPIQQLPSDPHGTVAQAYGAPMPPVDPNANTADAGAAQPPPQIAPPQRYERHNATRYGGARWRNNTNGGDPNPFK